MRQPSTYISGAFFFFRFPLFSFRAIHCLHVASLRTGSESQTRLTNCCRALYGGVRFVVQSNTAVDLVTGIGPRNASLIRHLDFVINFRFGPPDMLDSVRKACTGLKNLRAVPDAYYYFDSFRRKAALRDLDRVHHAFTEATDIQRTLVMSGSRDYVAGWMEFMEESTRQARMQAYFPILRRARELGWNVRREEKVNGRFPDGEFISYYPDGEYFDHGLNEIFEIIEDPLDVEELILEAVRKR